jgi:hypothetical protein
MFKLQFRAIDIVAGTGISDGKQAGITLHIDLLDITSDAGLIKKGPGKPEPFA